VVDPLAGSFFIESLTDQLEAKAMEWMESIDEQGGAVAAIENGYVQNAIGENAYRRELARSSGDEVVIGVNRHVEDEATPMQLHKIDQEMVARQIERVTAYKAQQDRDAVDSALAHVRETAAGEENLLPVMKEALLAGATLGQVANALRDVFGEHRPS
jgi:methylmalonyl-CoA mutase N-terminal domain/subunit